MLSVCAHAAPAPAPGRKATAVPYQFYALDIPNTKQAFTVSLNGWPISSNGGGPEGYFSSTRVGDSVADGQNTVTIHVLAPAHGAPPLDRFQVRIRATSGQVFYYDWEPNDPKRPLPFTTEGHFEAHLPHGPWAWQSAPKVTLDAKAKEGISAFVKRLFAALDAKNLDESTALFLLRNREDGLARGMTLAEADSENRSDWADSFKDPQWHMAPVDYAHLQYTLLADGRVVHVRAADGYSPLRVAKANADGSRDAYDVFLSLVNGEWTLIR